MIGRGNTGLGRLDIESTSGTLTLAQRGGWLVVDEAFADVAPAAAEYEKVMLADFTPERLASQNASTAENTIAASNRQSKNVNIWPRMFLTISCSLTSASK